MASWFSPLWWHEEQVWGTLQSALLCISTSQPDRTLTVGVGGAAASAQALGIRQVLVSLCQAWISVITAALWCREEQILPPAQGRAADGRAADSRASCTPLWNGRGQFSLPTLPGSSCPQGDHPTWEQSHLGSWSRSHWRTGTGGLQASACWKQSDRMQRCHPSCHSPSCPLPSHPSMVMLGFSLSTSTLPTC